MTHDIIVICTSPYVERDIVYITVQASREGLTRRASIHTRDQHCAMTVQIKTGMKGDKRHESQLINEAVRHDGRSIFTTCQGPDYREQMSKSDCLKRKKERPTGMHRIASSYGFTNCRDAFVFSLRLCSVLFQIFLSK